MIRNKKILITGGAGFIATNLVRRLINNNKIVVYDNLSRNSTKDSECLKHPNLKFVKGDILDYGRLKSIIPHDVDSVVHMAAIAGIDTVIKNSAKTMEVNMIGAYHLLKALDELRLLKRLDRLVNFSTSEVFGINAFHVDEKSPTNFQPVGEARWTYSVSKLAGEHLVHSYHKCYGLRCVIIRPFNIYGPRQIGEGAIHHFVVRAIKNEPLIIHGKGDQVRSWCYIDDMVDGIILTLTKKQAIGEVFNIGNPKGTMTILELAKRIIKLSGNSSKIVHVPKNYVDVELRIPSINKARKLLKFEPKISLDEGIKRTIDWYRNKLNII
jgi:UDP-glucuronate decarboxylase